MPLVYDDDELRHGAMECLWEDERQHLGMRHSAGVGAFSVGLHVERASVFGVSRGDVALVVLVCHSSAGVCGEGSQRLAVEYVFLAHERRAAESVCGVLPFCFVDVALESLHLSCLAHRVYAKCA